MTTERTLGARILDAAEAYALCANARTGGDAELATLRALADRADAAEMLATVVEWCDDDGWSFTSERYNQYHDAFAAWRAINKGVAP